MKKRGQFTVLVVFGLLAVLAVAFALMFKASVLNASSGLTQKAVNDFVESGQVNNYIGSCLEAVSSEAMLLVMFQGGNLWKHNPIEQVRYESGSDRQVAEIAIDEFFDISLIGYGDLSQSKCNLTRMYRDRPERPEYPHPERTLDELDDNPLEFRDYTMGDPDLKPWPTCTFYEDREMGYFGVRKMKAPCTLMGVNDDGAREEVSPEVRNICRKKDDKANRPVQWQLENYTMYHLERCANLTAIERIEGIRVEVGKPFVNIAMGKTEVIINASYSINAVGYPEEEFAVFFQHRIPIRFKELYEFLMEIVLEEVQDLGFDARDESQYEILPSYRAGFTVQNFHRANPTAADPPHLMPADNFNNLFRAMDDKSMIQGSPLMIYGILTNRRPVLNKFSAGLVDVSGGAGTEFREPNLIQLVGDDNLSFAIIPEAKDPDDPENDDPTTLVFDYFASNTPPEPFTVRILDDGEMHGDGSFEFEWDPPDDTHEEGFINITVTDKSGAIDLHKFRITLNDNIVCGDGDIAAAENCGEETLEGYPGFPPPVGAIPVQTCEEKHGSGYDYTGGRACDMTSCSMEDTCVRVGPTCGDGLLAAAIPPVSGEVCDGDTFAGSVDTCDEHFGDDFNIHGSRTCNDATCPGTVDYSDCDEEEKCGDGDLDDGETCDPSDSSGSDEEECSVLLGDGFVGMAPCETDCSGYDTLVFCTSPP